MSQVKTQYKFKSTVCFLSQDNPVYWIHKRTKTTISTNDKITIDEAHNTVVNGWPKYQVERTCDGEKVDHFICTLFTSYSLVFCGSIHLSLVLLNALFYINRVSKRNKSEQAIRIEADDSFNMDQGINFQGNVCQPEWQVHRQFRDSNLTNRHARKQLSWPVKFNAEMCVCVVVCVCGCVRVS